MEKMSFCLQRSSDVQIFVILRLFEIFRYSSETFPQTFLKRNDYILHSICLVVSYENPYKHCRCLVPSKYVLA